MINKQKTKFCFNCFEISTYNVIRLKNFNYNICNNCNDLKKVYTKTNDLTKQDILNTIKNYKENN